MKVRGFKIENSFIQQPQIKTLHMAHKGVMLDIFALLATNKDREIWGFLVDETGKPYSDRQMRSLLGLSHASWINTKEALMKVGVIKSIEIMGVAYLYSHVFIEQNPHEEIGKQQSFTSIGELKTNDYLGYDPTIEHKEKELKDWDWICQTWIELFGKQKPIFVSDMTMESRNDAKRAILKITDQIGINNIVNDMKSASNYKESTGGDIGSLFYFLARWRNKLVQGNKFDIPEIPDDILGKSRKISDKTKQWIQEIRIQVKKGTVKTKEELYAYYPKLTHDLLDICAKEIGLYEQ